MPIESEQAWDILSKSKKLFVAKGKKVLEFTPDAASKDQILKESIGRSGKLRAPTVQIDDVSYVGFQADMYADMVK